MRPRNLLLAGAMLVAALSAAACSGCTTPAWLSNDRGALENTVIDEKALYAAEAALFGANTAAEAAADNGLLKPGSPDAVKVADYLDAAKKALNVARIAYRAGDAKTYVGKLAAVQATVAQAWLLIPQASA